MSQLTTFIRSLGAEGAVANVQTVLDARRQEDWVVTTLSARLDRADSPMPISVPTGGSSVTAA